MSNHALSGVVQVSAALFRTQANELEERLGNPEEFLILARSIMLNAECIQALAMGILAAQQAEESSQS